MNTVANVFDAEVFKKGYHDRIKELCSTTMMENFNAILSSTKSCVDKHAILLLKDKFWTVAWKTKNCLIPSKLLSLLYFFTLYIVYSFAVIWLQ